MAQIAQSRRQAVVEQLERRGASSREIRRALEELHRRNWNLLKDSGLDEDSVLERFGIEIDGDRVHAHAAEPDGGTTTASSPSPSPSPSAVTSALGGHVVISTDGRGTTVNLSPVALVGAAAATALLGGAVGAALR